jgi:hypothetical protein
MSGLIKSLRGVPDCPRDLRQANFLQWTIIDTLEITTILDIPLRNIVLYYTALTIFLKHFLF